MQQRTDRKTLMSENRRLKHRLDVTQEELQIIKGSRAYRTIRLVGHVINQTKKSPLGFTKKMLKKIVGGQLKPGLLAAQKNLNLQKSLEEQYKEWIAFNEPDITELAQQAKHASNFQKRPLISIITPVFDPPQDAFIELIESVLAQTYDNFELCLQSFGDSKEIGSIIAEYAKKDSRIKDLGSGVNKGIAGNSNTLLEAAAGEYIALLDHDDTLSPDALYENVKLLNEADYDFIYSDKDKIDESGNRFDPFFKPSWSPEIMLNANYLTHLNVMKTALVRKVGGWDTATDGAQDWDLFLKVVGASKKIGHIPKVLYHWRVIATSTAFSLETKPYALLGQRNAVDAYLQLTGQHGHSYHEGAELLIDWGSSKKKPELVLFSSSLTDLRGFLSVANNLDSYGSITILHSYKLGDYAKELRDQGFNPVRYTGENLAKVLSGVIGLHKNADIVLANENVVLDIDSKQLEQLRGWLRIKEVKAVGPRIVNQDGFTLDCGALITAKSIRPIFMGSPPYHQAAIGNIEWVRNLRILTPVFTVIAANDILATIQKHADSLKFLEAENLVSALHLLLSAKDRLVFNPKVMLKTRNVTEIDAEAYYEDASFLLEALNDSGFDPYFNQNLSSDDPMMLASIKQSSDPDEDLHEQLNGYQTEALTHAMNRSLTAAELRANRDHIKRTNRVPMDKIATVIIILPDFHAIYAGLNNIFYFADRLRATQKARIIFALLANDEDCDRQRKLIADKYPDLADSSVVMPVSPESIDTLPESDVAICTQWATAYTLAVYNKTKRKCYFIQDKESSFYPRGTISALVDNTYTFGFFALANTDGLLDWYKNEFGGTGVVLRSRIDIDKYAPPDNLNVRPQKPFKVFFYARPNESRNAFESGIAGLLELKNRMGTELEVYTAGADWDPYDYGLEGMVENLGKIAYEKLPIFYRDMDAGMMFMYSGHPGVVASELMASGCPVVVNKYHDITWNYLYEDRMTALESGPTRDEIADTLETALTNTALRETLIKNGLRKVESFYGDYEEAFQMAIKGIIRGTGSAKK